GVEPWHQAHWDWKAAGNFICGGTGTGLFACAALASFSHDMRGLAWAGLALVALGLFLVWLKIGRPWRFINVLRQPQRSWMAREAWSGSPAWLIPAAGLGVLFLFSQAMILYAAKGIPAWRTPAIVPLMVTTGL